MLWYFLWFWYRGARAYKLESGEPPQAGVHGNQSWKEGELMCEAPFDSKRERTSQGFAWLHVAAIHF